jgi:hypothetical protein
MELEAVNSGLETASTVRTPSTEDFAAAGRDDEILRNQAVDCVGICGRCHTSRQKFSTVATLSNCVLLSCCHGPASANEPAERGRRFCRSARPFDEKHSAGQ